MKRYTVLEELSTRQPIGSVVRASDFKPGVADILVAKNALAPVHTPPLSELPGWTRRSEILRAINVVTIQDFLDADAENVARLFNYQSSTIRKWKRDVQDEWITTEPAPRRGR